MATWFALWLWDWVLRPGKTSPIAKEPCIHAGRPRPPGSDALLFGLAFAGLVDYFIAVYTWCA